MDRQIDPIHALHEPAARLALLIRPFPLRDVDQHAMEPGGAVTFQHHGHLVSQPHHTAVGGDHAVLEVVSPLLGRFFTEPHHRLAIVRVEVILPECRVGDPAFHRIAEDALGLVAHERELKGRGVCFPDDPVDRIDQVPESVLGSHGLGGGSLQTLVAALQLRCPLEHSRLELRPGMRQGILRPASRGAHRGQQRGQQRKDHQTRQLGRFDLQGVERTREVVLEGQRGQHPGNERRSQTADPARDQDRHQQQLRGGHHHRSQPQRHDHRHRHAEHGDAVSDDSELGDMALHQPPFSITPRRVPSVRRRGGRRFEQASRGTPPHRPRAIGGASPRRREPSA